MTMTPRLLALTLKGLDAYQELLRQQAQKELDRDTPYFAMQTLELHAKSQSTRVVMGRMYQEQWDREGTPLETTEIFELSPFERVLVAQQVLMSLRHDIEQIPLLSALGAEAMHNHAALNRAINLVSQELAKQATLEQAKKQYSAFENSKQYAMANVREDDE